MGKIVIYADVLFLVNFSMDILTLYTAGRLNNRKMTKWRTAIASLIGSLIATTATLINSSNSTATRLVSILSAIVASVIMACICYGKYPRVGALLRDSVIIWGAGSLLGGIMTVILSIGETVQVNSSGAFPAVFLLCLLATLGLLRFIISSKSKTIAEVKILVRGEKVTLTALCDSGSFAADPISGKPVILVKSMSFPGIASELYSDHCALSLRIIPIDSVGGSSVLRGFVPERVWVGENEVAAIIAVDVKAGSFKGYDGLIPAALCR